MTSIEFLGILKEKAIEYAPLAKKSVIRNSHMNNLNPDDYVKQQQINAVIVDFINYIGSTYNVDYAMYTKDLDVKNHE